MASFPTTNASEISQSDQVVAVYTKLFARNPDTADARLAEFRKQFEEDAIDIWRFAEWADSYAALYEATRDATYVDALTKLCELALEFRDDRMGRVDKLTGQSLPVWGRIDPYFRKRTVDIGSAALILAPIARLHRYLKDDPALANRLKIDPHELQAQIKRSLATFNGRFSVKGTTGRYLKPLALSNLDCDQFSDDISQKVHTASRATCIRLKTKAGEPEPYNLQLRAALVYVLLGDTTSVEHARQIADDFFRTSRFTLSPEGAASFDYAQGGRPEDVSHFNLDVEFFLEVVQSIPGMTAAGRSIDRALLIALSKTIIDVAAVRVDEAIIPSDVPSGHFVLTPYIDGRFARRINDKAIRDDVLGKRFSRIRRSCKQVTELVSVEPKIAEVCGYDLRYKNALSPSGLAHLAKGFRLRQVMH